MSDLIKVSIIIPAYNSEKTISATLDTVVKQTLSDIEIIIIDDMFCLRDINTTFLIKMIIPVNASFDTFFYQTMYLVA